MLYRCEFLAQRVGNLCCRGYLPVEVPAVDSYAEGICLGLLIGIHHHKDSFVIKLERGKVEPEILRVLINGGRQGITRVGWGRLLKTMGGDTVMCRIITSM